MNYHWGCTSTFRPLSYPFKSLASPRPPPSHALKKMKIKRVEWLLINLDEGYIGYRIAPHSKGKVPAGLCIKKKKIIY